ncbi:TetR/AcrR family transcriptional regulator [Paenibacillus sp. EKM208P]|uniref:TetR/AcrR family transcriptional regulator n=1 Tax=Paenibacillus peoriae TaxID=59893 RepID=A0A7H0YDB2_9BACL|nr:TetR/AcrR family transcriptional regulator [Paenibacillus peoriae]KAF6637409.1 TetR/AcrR family transcriptional regulator [Paenibacillus sp. EKM208P]QNR69070.1 TetR/AcrR family transcriptional regulator [Paenibacillus peoriae]
MGDIQGDKYEAILDAAYTIFGTKGFYESKISEIAEQAGVAKGTVYLYFKSKEQLFTAVTRRDCEQYLAEMQSALINRTLGEGLLRMANLHLHYYFKRKQHTKLFFMTPNSDPDLMEFMREFIQDYTDLVKNKLASEGVQQPEFHAKAFIGMMERLKMDILLNKDFRECDVDQTAELAANLFMHGCKAGIQKF